MGRTNTRDRILDVTAEMFRRYGYTGTGLKQIVAGANAPFGSLYHHFPGGKRQLGEEVIRRSGQMYFELVAAVFDAAPDPVQGASDVFTAAAAVLRATDFADACPIATVALEVASTNELLRRATADVFESWIQGAAARVSRAGVEPERARELAIALIAALEGAFVLARAMRSTEPLEAAGASVAAAMREALDGQPRKQEPAGR
jgi:AcrR family transcriptional regulator